MKALDVAIALNNKIIEENVMNDLVTREKVSLAATVAKLDRDLSKAKEEYSNAITKKDSQLESLQRKATATRRPSLSFKGQVKNLEAALNNANGRREDERPDL